MWDDDHRRSRPFGSSRRSGERGLFDRVMRDVASWFDDDDDEGRSARGSGGDDEEGLSGRRAPGPRSRPDARARDPAEDVGDAGVGSVAEQPARKTDDYDDEDDERERSLRGRGPKGYRRTDERLTELVSDALYDDDEVDARDVTVSVTDGDVRLHGTVPRRRHKHRAENVAARVSGVHDVDNRLRVRRETSAAGGAPADAAGAGGLPGDAARDANDYGH